MSDRRAVKQCRRQRKDNMTSAVRCSMGLLLVGVVGVALPLNAETFYVKADGGSDGNGGKSPDAAFATIQKAIDSAASGDKIMVYDGVYSPITCDNVPLTIESVNGPGNAIIDGGETNRVADLDLTGNSGQAPTNTVLRGFTVRNGYGNVGGGLYGGTAEHCIISNNVAGMYGGGTIQTACYDCLITDNYADYYGGGTAYGDVRRCIIVGNSAFCGGGTYQSPTRNSLIIFNTVDGGGGGSYQNSLYHCTVYGNSADQGGGIFSGKVINCIFANNEANAGSDTYSANMTYSCATDNVNLQSDGEGNIAVDPSFVDAALGDFHLTKDSPCVNAGSVDDSALTDGPDLDGNPRVCDGRTDMGAYEYQPIPDPGTKEIWGEWSTDDSQSYVVPESVSSWDELSKVLWQARDAFVRAGARTEIPPSENAIVLSLGAMSVPEQLLAADPAIETEMEHGVSVWRLRVVEDAAACALIAVAGKTSFELSSVPSYLANAWVNAVYGETPVWLDADGTEAWYAARSRSRIGWFVTLVPQSQWATYCANRAAEAVAAQKNEEHPLVVKGFSSDPSTSIHMVSVRSLAAGETRLWSKDTLSADEWTYNGYSLQAAGTTSAGVHSPSNQTFVLATFNEVTAGSTTDTDGDGIPDIMEQKVYGTNPSKADSSGDGISDWEKVFHYDLNPRVRDTSGDGIDDDEKIAAGVDPRVAVGTDEREAAKVSIRYYYDDDDRLTGTYVGLGGASTTTKLTPAGNPKEIRERDAAK